MKYVVIRYNQTNERYERRTEPRTEPPLTVWERVNGDEFVAESGWEPVTHTKIVYPDTASGTISLGGWFDVRKA